MKIDLQYNYGFTWHKTEKVYAKGYIYENGFLIDKLELAKKFDSITTFSDFCGLIASLNGAFTVLLHLGDDTFIAVDRLRTFPVFYNKSQNIISDCLRTYFENNLEFKSVEEYEALGYVSGKETLLTNWFQVEAGTCMSFRDNRIHTYYTYQTSSVDSNSLEINQRKLNNLLHDAFLKCLGGLNGRQAIIPLSGGYDSRLIAAYFKKLGYENVLCYTYGNPSNPEINTSREVAGRLGYQWHFVNYKDVDFVNLFEDDEFLRYIEYGANCHSMFFLQEYFAIRELKKQGLLASDAVFIPGLSGDFIAGSHLKLGINESSSTRTIVKAIVEKNYIFKPKIKKELRKKVLSQLNSAGFGYSIFENWDLKERQAKYIVNYIREHEFFGYEHRMPFWDSELMDFFKTLPYEQKLHKNLYDKTLKEGIFDEMSLNLNKEHQASKKELYVQGIKNTVKKLLPSFIVRKFQNPSDNYYTSAVAKELLKDLNSSGMDDSINGCEVYLQWYLHHITK